MIIHGCRRESLPGDTRRVQIRIGESLYPRAHPQAKVWDLRKRRQDKVDTALVWEDVDIPDIAPVVLDALDTDGIADLVAVKRLGTREVHGVVWCALRRGLGERRALLRGMTIHESK
jgi:hypothetical protein